MERFRIIPRLRPRPYDLRRKVLLKNFLREQVAYIPHIRSTEEASLEVNNDLDVNENDSNTNEGNILTPKKVQDNIVTPISVPEPAPSTSNCREKENSNHPEGSSAEEIPSNINEVEERPSSKISTLSRIIETIDLRLSARRNRRKGITKAKHELRPSKGILKPAVRKVVKDTESPTKISAKSFFARFKSRRDKRRKNSTLSKITNLLISRNPTPTKCNSKVATTSTQSVQTDASWSPDHYEKIEQSNRSLLEENRLLSESLTSIITNTDSRSSSIQTSCCTDSYINSSNKSTAYSSPEQRPVNKTVANGSHSQADDPSRTRILRSKSMQTRSETRNPAPSRLRTRSLTFRYMKRPYDADSFVTNESHFSEQERYRLNPIASPVSSRAKTRPSVLRSIATPPLCIRNAPSLLETLPSKSGKPITRRSSMPERTYNWSYRARPVRSSSMRENNVCSYMSECLSTRSSHRRRSSTSNGYSYSVPFQNLPAEAFY